MALAGAAVGATGTEKKPPTGSRATGDEWWNPKSKSSSNGADGVSAEEWTSPDGTTVLGCSNGELTAMEAMVTTPP